MAEDISPHSSQQSGGLVQGLDPQPISMRYLEAYGYIFQNPNWAMNLLWGSLCQLVNTSIPLLGIVASLLFMGYQFEIVESLHRYPNRQYPDFDFNRFSEYLLRGLWLFLTSLLLGILISVVIVPLLESIRKPIFP